MDHKVNWKSLSESQKDDQRRRNNPARRPCGPYTGRCTECESSDLWDDATWYGCNHCGMMYPNG